MPRWSQSLEERFRSKTDKTTDNCWLWTGAKNGFGYGTIKIDGKTINAHRTALELEGIDIPSGMLVRHKCDIAACVNPDHLELGTQSDNMQDMYDRDRHPSPKLTRQDVERIKNCVLFGSKQADVARMYEISPSHVNSIIKGRRWQ